MQIRTLIVMIAALVALAAALVLLSYLHFWFFTHDPALTELLLQELNRSQIILATVALLIAFVLLMVGSIYSGRRLYLKAKRSYDELNLFNDGLPAIVFKSRLDNNMTLDYVSDGINALTGYTEKEFKQQFNNHFIELVHPDDRERVLHNATRRIRYIPIVQERYRIVRKNGSLLWVGADYRLTQTTDGDSAFGIVLDVSERVRAEREIAISREKFRIALKHTPNMYMEYLHEGSVLINTDAKASFLGLPQRITNSPESLIEAGYILPESVDVLRRMHERIISGEEHVAYELHVKMPGMESDAWLHVNMINIFMPDGEPTQAVVLLRDITKEKIAEHDHLTGLFNRESGEARIRAALLENVQSRHAFLMFDIDHFKQINDTYGHYTGDSVLRAFAQTLSGCFRESDVVCRLGGDEFVVFMRDIHTPELAVKRAETVLEATRTIEFAGTRGSVCASCGIAFFPDDGEDVSTLYKHADDALYRAKQAGRCRLVVYGDAQI